MNEKTVVVVFPSLFSLNKINSLVSSISMILKAKKQTFDKIEKKDSIIIIVAKDPVFVSTIINSLFGIEKVAIATQVESNFNSVVSAIAKIGANLVLNGERFYVKVDGKTAPYMPKDVELAATSLLIEKTINLQAKPGTEKNHDKMIYTYLTKSHAYVCIFVDKGGGGTPYRSQRETVLCCLYDELSVISCLQAIKMGFDVKILVCYRNEVELLNLVKMMERVLPRISQTKIELDFYKLDVKFSGKSGLLLRIAIITEILLSVAIKSKINRVSLAISPLIFPVWFIEYNMIRAFQKGVIPWVPLSGIDNSIFETAREIGLEKYMSKLENLCRTKFSAKSIPKEKVYKTSQVSLRSRKTINIPVGPKNIHDIIDSLRS
jgi:adenylyl- and sulfurtransferase ThiI